MSATATTARKTEGPALDTAPSSARYVLFAAVTSVLTLGAIEARPARLERPQDDAQVLAEVPARSDVEVQALEQLQKRARATPTDLTTALGLAQRYIEASRRDGDPRYLGAAEGALAPFTALPEPPPQVRLLSATILQSRHEFDAALVQLERVVSATPDDAQAWLTLATVYTVQGRYDDARRSCARLTPLVSATYAVACVAPIDAITGHGREARAMLERTLSLARSDDERAYLHSLLGEQAYWLGVTRQAEHHLTAALALAPSDRYSRAVYADLLLDAGRSEEARKLVREHTADDALLLRYALADLSLGQRDAPELRRVEQNFEASRLRGDAVHRREEARMWLARGDAQRALRCAKESWAVQHEAWDARLVLAAALAAKRPDEARDVLEWLERTGFEAPLLRSLAVSLKETP